MKVNLHIKEFYGTFRNWDNALISRTLEMPTLPRRTDVVIFGSKPYKIDRVEINLDLQTFDVFSSNFNYGKDNIDHILESYHKEGWCVTK